MRAILHISLLVLFITVNNSSIISNAGSLTDYLKRSLRTFRDSLHEELPRERARFEVKQNDADDNINPKTITLFKSHDIKFEPNKFHGSIQKYNKKMRHFPVNHIQDGPYQLDPVLNSLRRKTNFRRADSTSKSDSSSSSIEEKDWKTEWKEHWIKKKLEAINSTEPRGDIVNMVAARPWGMTCGDPNQHDMPWGTCMMPMECEPEYRIYRGDFSCGRTQFVCCALIHTNYDLYQGFDASFADSSLSTDSEEKRNKGRGSKEKREKKRQRDKKHRKNERRRRKKKIKKNIKKIIREIRKILNRQYVNATTQRKKKTKAIKKFIKELKRKYKQDRKSVKSIHEIQLIKIDKNLLKKLDEIKLVNENFMRNETFRQIVVNGTITKEGARMLVDAYPELIPYFASPSLRRSNADKPMDYLDYDIEYGMLYY